MSEKRIAPLFLLLTSILWSFNGVLTKYIVWSGFTCAVLRGSISFVCLSLALRRKVWKLKLNRYKILGAVCFMMQSLLYIAALKYTTAANASVLQNTSPIYIMVLNALILHKLPKRQDILAFFALLVGVVITFAGNLEGGGALGNCMALLSGCFYSGVFFFNKMPQVDDPVETTLLGNALYLFLLPFCFLDPAFPNPSPTVWAAQISLSLLCGAGAWLAFSRGIRHTSALLANFITIIELPAGAALTFFFLGERPSPLALVGCVAVIVTLLVYYTWQAKHDEDTAPTESRAE